MTPPSALGDVAARSVGKCTGRGRLRQKWLQTLAEPFQQAPACVAAHARAGALQAGNGVAGMGGVAHQVPALGAGDAGRVRG